MKTVKKMTIVLITGGNRGIGLEICRQMEELGFFVIMGSRDLNKGKLAARTFSKHVVVRQLDVTDTVSILKLRQFTEMEFGKLDILINNAGIWTSHSNFGKLDISNIRKFMDTNFPGIAQKIRNSMPGLRKAGIISQVKGAEDISLSSVKHLMETNFYGAWRMIQAFIPLLKKSEEGRIINMSSGMGELKSLSGVYPAYSLSKSSLNALSIMFSNELKETRIKVNAMCPGWVRTEMGGPNAPRTVSEGADTAVWLATATEIPSGKFFRDRKEIDW